MVNKALVKSPKNTQKLSTAKGQPLSAESKTVLGAINKTRLVQGWGMMPLADAKIVASVWMEQLERKGINVKLCNQLVDLAIDYRAGEISAGRNPPNFSVELLIAMFATYREQTYAKHRELKTEIVHLRDRIVVRGTDEGDERLLKKLEKTEGTFLEDHYLWSLQR